MERERERFVYGRNEEHIEKLKDKKGNGVG